MPFERQTLSQVVEEVESGIASRLPGADTRLRRSVLSVLARVVGGVAYGLDAFIGYKAKQIFPMTADEEHLPRLARPWRVFQKHAEVATGHVIIKGIEGKVFPVGELLQQADGIQYKSTSEAVVINGTALILVECLTPGAEGNSISGTSISLVQPVKDFEPSGKVADGGITGGVDIEDIEEMRQRLITRWQEPPQGGAVVDWIAWALEVPGVTRAWAYARWMGLGTVGVLFTTDNTENPIPDDKMVQRVAEYLNEESRKPITAEVFVNAPTAKLIDIEIQDLFPATEAVKEAVRNELKDLFRREGEPGRVMLISHIREAISTAVGEYDHVLLKPLGNILSERYELLVLGNVIFTTSKNLDVGDNNNEGN